MEPVHPYLLRPVDEVRLDVVEGAVRVAVQEDPAARHGAAPDHLVHEAAGKQRGLIREGAGGGHPLQLVLGVLLVRAEKVIPVGADADETRGAPVLVRQPQRVQHLEHGGEHVPRQGSRRDAGQDEILIPEAGLAPAQEGEDHRDRLAAADGAVGEHHAVMLLSGSGMPPVQGLLLLPAEGLKMKGQGSLLLEQGAHRLRVVPLEGEDLLREALRVPALIRILGGEKAVELLLDERRGLFQLIKAGPADLDQAVLAQHVQRLRQRQAVDPPAPAGELLLRRADIAENLRNLALQRGQLLKHLPGHLPAEPLQGRFFGHGPFLLSVLRHKKHTASKPDIAGHCATSTGHLFRRNPDGSRPAGFF